MEKYKELIRLCQQRKRSMGASVIIDVHNDREILNLTEELSVLAVYERDGKYEIQLRNLEDLYLLECNPKQIEDDHLFDPNSIYIHYEAEIDGIIFTKVMSKTKEEHKKTQVI